MTKKIFIIYTAFLAITIFLVSCIDVPVNDDYFMDINKVKGKNPPTMPEFTMLSSCNSDILFSFSGGSDPDGDDLYYIIYFSLKNPDIYFDESDYYKEIYILDIYDEPLTVVTSTSFNGTIYFWITAYDGGRESDHTPVRSVTTPGTDCE